MLKLRRRGRINVITTLMVLLTMSAWAVMPRDFCVPCVIGPKQSVKADCHEYHACCPSAGTECHTGEGVDAHKDTHHEHPTGPQFSKCPVPPPCFVISSSSNFLLPENPKQELSGEITLLALPIIAPELPGLLGRRDQAAASYVACGRPLYRSNCILRI